MSQLSEKTDSMPPRRNVTEELGRGFLQALSAWRMPALSLHDSSGETLWLSEGSIGPDEHSVVLGALDVFALEPQRNCIHRKLEDGRRALLLAARDPLGGCSGVVFAIIEGGMINEQRLITPVLRVLLQRLSMLLAPAVDKSRPAAVEPEAAEVNALPEGAPIHARCYTRLQQGGGTRRYEISVTPANSSHDASVVERVMEWLTQNRQRYVTKPSTFAVAISVAAACDPAFPARLEQSLARHECDEGMLMLVVPAPAWQEHPQRVSALLAVCERLRIHVILDDFRLNEVGLEHLRSKAVRMIKISPELTAAAMDNRYARALLSACVQIARVLGIHCIAKRVTSPAASHWLASAGVDYVDPLKASETDAATVKASASFLRQVS